MMDVGLDLAVCATCGTQFAAPTPPDCCPICADERQYVGHGGQRWTTLAELRHERRNAIRPVEPGLTGIGTEPTFAIGQRALLLEAPGGNILWDCVTLLDDATIAAVRERGGIAAIAISHPHFYSAMVAWGRAFEAPIYLHAADRRHVSRPDPAIRFWDGDAHPLGDGLTLIRCGGHFAGSTTLHWAVGAGGRGSLLTGDTIQVVADRHRVGFMRSYPNLIPLPADAVRRIANAVAPFSFDRLHGGWWDGTVERDAKTAVARSAARYVAALEGRLPGDD
jgi:hypothetical protein